MKTLALATTPNLTRRTSLLALSLGSGAMVAGMMIKPAEAQDDECPIQTALEKVGRTNRLRELYRDGAQVPPIPPHDKSSLQADLIELMQMGGVVEEDECDLLCRLVDGVGELVSGTFEAVDDAYNSALQLYEEISDGASAAARTVAAVFMDGFEYLRDRYQDLISRAVDPVELMISLVYNVRIAINGLLSAAAVLRALQLPNNPVFLALGGLIAAAAESLSAHFDAHYPR